MSKRKLAMAVFFMAVAAALQAGPIGTMTTILGDGTANTTIASAAVDIVMIVYEGRSNTSAAETLTIYDSTTTRCAYTIAPGENANAFCLFKAVVWGGLFPDRYMGIRCSTNCVVKASAGGRFKIWTKQ
jgi:hypothetical protein